MTDTTLNAELERTDVAVPGVASPRAHAAPVLHTEDELRPGDQVEVRRKFDRAWARGFRIHAAGPEGYELIRCSDGALLPVPFPASDLRSARVDVS